MATLLEIANNVLLETGYQSLSTIVGNDTVNARRVLAAAQREGKSLAKKDWKILLKRNTITLASSADAYALPNDFDRFIDATHWNTSDQQRMTGPLTTEEWQANESGVGTVGISDNFQIRADGNTNRFWIDPTPTSAETISFYYATNTWCRSQGGVRQSKWLADNDVLLLDDYVYELGIRWRWLKAMERPFDAEFAEYTVERDKAFARDGGMKRLSILGPRDDMWVAQANTGEMDFG